MHPVAVFAVLLALIAVTTVAGLLWRRSQGRTSSVSGSAVDIPRLAAGTVSLVQFSSPMCASCVPTRALLSDIAGSTDAVSHVEFDVADHPELASRLGILQTPTTLVVDEDGRVRSRIGGPPRRAELTALLDTLVAERGPRIGAVSA